MRHKCRELWCPHRRLYPHVGASVEVTRLAVNAPRCDLLCYIIFVRLEEMLADPETLAVTYEAVEPSEDWEEKDEPSTVDVDELSEEDEEDESWGGWSPTGRAEAKGKSTIKGKSAVKGQSIVKKHDQGQGMWRGKGKSAVAWDGKGKSAIEGKNVKGTKNGQGTYNGKGKSAVKVKGQIKGQVKGAVDATVGLEDPGPSCQALKEMSAPFAQVASAASLDAAAMQVQNANFQHFDMHHFNLAQSHGFNTCNIASLPWHKAMVYLGLSTGGLGLVSRIVSAP